MKFYNSVGPNPKVVRMFMAERNIKIEQVEIDILSAANRLESFQEKKPQWHNARFRVSEWHFFK